MRTIEYHTVDKSNWGEGPWRDEPDKKQWLDEATGYPCLIVRNLIGALCGYVGVKPGHPAYGRGCDEVDVEVHGGLTFAGRCQVGRPESEGVCHLVDDEDHVFWLGFDCGHAWDLMPTTVRFHEQFPKGYGVPDDVYRDFDYVTDEVRKLAGQLKAME